MRAPIGLTNHELGLATVDACAVPAPPPGYWLGPAATWRARALAAEGELAELRRRLAEWRPAT
jgi:hypothetical protein